MKNIKFGRFAKLLGFLGLFCFSLSACEKPVETESFVDGSRDVSQKSEPFSSLTEDGFVISHVAGGLRIEEYKGSEKKVVIPKTIGDYPVVSLGKAFQNNRAIESVRIPDTLEMIGDYAFQNCFSLKKINIPDSLISVGKEAFLGCKNLESISFPKYFRTIGERAFFGCEALTSIEIPSGVRQIDASAFERCTSLVSAVFNNSWFNFSKRLFAECVSLTDIVFPGSYFEVIGDEAFYGCSSLRSIRTGVKHIGNGAFAECASLTSVTLSRTVNTIGTDAFKSCTALNTIIIPDSVSVLKDTFVSCDSLAYAILPNTITTISGAFKDCDSLTSVFYFGTNREWEGVDSREEVETMPGMTVYFYSETAPSESGNYWHYVDNVPTAW